ncbi:MAG: hypothetical protein U0169_03650 [Polyangiaceae bacterium]
MKKSQVEELILQALEHELGGVQIYTTALRCVVNTDLEKEWRTYLSETKDHVKKLEKVCAAMDIDTERQSVGREITRANGSALVDAMEIALDAGNLAVAQLVACDVVVLAETKDHANWQLLSKCAERLEGEGAEALREICDEVEGQEDEHLYHSKGWCRELWIESLGMHPVLPPPEARKDVTSAIGAARAEAAAEKTRGRSQAKG